MNLVEPYKMLAGFISYLICVGGAALIVRAQGARDEVEMKKLYNHCFTCSLAVGLACFAVFSLFETPLVTLAAGESSANSSIPPSPVCCC